MRVECFAATLPQRGRTEKDNEDAFLVSLEDPPVAVLCDGAGSAARAAKKVLQLFQKHYRDSTARLIADQLTWLNWVQTLDAALLKGPPSTFLAVAILDTLAAGVCVGNSRAYLVNATGESRHVTEGAGKHQLGSCKAVPLPIRENLKPGETLLLLSDGAWLPLASGTLHEIVSAAAARHFSQVPKAILEAASRHGRLDDMTAIALRVLS
jgi:serine/threonine protein phosphatase PrpC